MSTETVALMRDGRRWGKSSALRTRQFYIDIITTNQNFVFTNNVTWLSLACTRIMTYSSRNDLEQGVQQVRLHRVCWRDRSVEAWPNKIRASMCNCLMVSLFNFCIFSWFDTFSNSCVLCTTTVIAFTTDFCVRASFRSALWVVEGICFQISR